MKTNRSNKMNRREFLRSAGFLSAALLIGGRPPVLFGTPSVPRFMPDMPPTEMFMPDAEIAITAVEKTVQIFPGAPTQVMSYEGQLLSGSGVTVSAVPGSYLGPVLHVEKGKKLRILFHNQLQQESVIHPHGLRVPEESDGMPMQAIGPGETKIYEFQVIDRAGPYWFHPHPMMLTAHQVAMGLAGIFNVWDAEEAVTVPGASTAANDVPVIIQDRTFDANNQFVYQPHHMWGFLGDRILVNGQVNAAFSLEPRGYRLRVLNGSNARTYKLAWSNNMPLKVIGTDGGLLPEPVSKPYVMLMSGERVDLWVDFSSLAGKQVFLRSLAFDPGMSGGGGGGGMGGGGMGGGGMGGGGMGGGGMNGTALPMGAAFDILKVNVARRTKVKPVLGTFPPLSEKYDASNVMNFNNPVPFTLDMQQMVWTINGRVYEDMAVAEDEYVYLNETTAWEWINNSPIPHPMHMHTVQFQVVQRISPNTSSYSTISQGLIDTGWKDTVLVWPGERVKIAMRNGPYTGMYMYHCHILEHEDMGMMRNFMIMERGMPGM